MQKDPIEVEPPEGSSHLSPASRIRFGKIYSIEWNVKVKDLGRVISSHLSSLLAYYNEEISRCDLGD